MKSQEHWAFPQSRLSSVSIQTYLCDVATSQKKVKIHFVFIGQRTNVYPSLPGGVRSSADQEIPAFIGDPSSCSQKFAIELNTTSHLHNLFPRRYFNTRKLTFKNNGEI
jgi:hypothetical protein